MRLLGALLLMVTALGGQILPGRYVVELSRPPLGSLARVRSASAVSNARRAEIRAEQRSTRLWIEQRHGRVLSALNGVMNALAVEIPEAEAAALSAAPGVTHVYPVYTVYPVLDHALPLHSVPAAWAAIGGMDRAGAGVKIAMLDSGISPDHPGFQDSALAVPAGYPLASKPENLALTNHKIIVARSYEQFYDLAARTDTARDRNGHGTATAMCAAGVPNTGPLGSITGVAPKAWLGIYKITYLNTRAAATDVVLKAVDDALADGMDIINLSYGTGLVPPLDQDAASIGLGRATQLGMIVVASAGNDGPDLGTVQNFASVPSVISVGASGTDRTFSAAVTMPGAGPYAAFASTAAVPDQPISAPLMDAGRIALGGSLCTPPAAASAAGHILIGRAGDCAYETQLINASVAGATAVIFYPASPQQSPMTFSVGRAQLPAVMIGFQDAAAVEKALGATAVVPGKINFSGVPFAGDPATLFSFSSGGPTYTDVIKPDLSATGYVYTAVQSFDPQGELYDKSNYMGISGTSFSAPLVAGAAAVLKAARPGLTVNQYRSLLIGSATPLVMKNGGVERVQRTGSGILNLAAAVNENTTTFPTSLSFGAGGSVLDSQRPLTLTNVGKKADTLSVSAIPYDEAPPPTFSEDPRGVGAARVATLNLAPGQSKTIYTFWRLSNSAAGEYQGLVGIESAGAAPAFVPYWYGVASDVPASVTLVNGVPGQYPVGQSFNVYFRVVDSAGVPVLDPDALEFQGTALSGGGSVAPMDFSALYPNLVYTVFKMGSNPVDNVFSVSFAGLTPRTFTVTGTRTAGR